MTATTNKYDALDRAILNKMGGHPQRLAVIFVRDVRTESEKIAQAEGGNVQPSHVLDRRLQALRKAGKIRSTSKGWLRANPDAKKSEGVDQ